MGRYPIGEREAAIGDFSSTAEAAVAALGGKWKIVLVWLLEEKPRRFSELRRLLPKVSQKVLSSQLKQLESHGLISREEISVTPPHVEYAITDYGRTAHDLIEAMCGWGEEHCRRYNFRADWT